MVVHVFKKMHKYNRTRSIESRFLICIACIGLDWFILSCWKYNIQSDYMVIMVRLWFALVIWVVFFYHRKWSCSLVGCGCSMVEIGKVEEGENVDTSSANRVRRWKVWDRIQLIISLCENEVVWFTCCLCVYSLRVSAAKKMRCILLP